METEFFPTEVLESRVKRWLEGVRREKSASLACNQPLSYVSCDGAGKEILFALQTSRYMENPWGVTHGGYLAMAMDWAMGIASRTILDQNNTPTVSMQIDYLKPVPLDSRLYIRVRVDHAGRTVSHLSARGYLDLNGPCYVSASGNYLMREKPLKFYDTP